jgi:signal transduction histidine kinase
MSKPRRGRRVVLWEIGATLAIATLGIWLEFAGPLWAWTAVVLAGMAVVLSARRAHPPSVATSVLCLAGAGAALHTSWQVGAVEHRWPMVREGLILRASQRLEEALGEAVAHVEALAERGANLGASSQAQAFALLEGGLAGRSPERGVVVFSADHGDGPWAWAGSLRLPTTPGRPGLRARLTPFYVVLEAQRERPGRVAVAQVVLNADSAVPNRELTVAARFARATGSGLQFFSPDNAPAGADVFDYCLPPCDDITVVPDTLFSVRPVPPSQGALKLELLERGGRRVAVALIAALLVLVVVSRPWLRWTSIAACVVLFLETPLGARLGLGSLFSPRTYFFSVLEYVNASAGSLLVVGSVIVLAVAAFWRRERPTWRGTLIPAAVIVGPFPFILHALTDGVTPPEGGLDPGTWLGWTTSISVVATALLVVASRLVRMASPGSSPTWTSWLAVGWALVVSLVGLLIWQPSSGWPAWYPVMWVPAFLLAVLPVRGPRTIVTAAVVSGTAVCLLTWGAVLRGALVLAERDLGRFHEEVDPFADRYLDRLGTELQSQDVPRTAAELYATWRRSPLAELEYPAALNTWGPQQDPIAVLDLAALELPVATVRDIAARSLVSHAPTIVSVRDVPGAYYVLAVPYPDESVVTVAVGPRSRAVPSQRIADFLSGNSRVSAPYEMTLSERQPEGTGFDTFRWRREGFLVRGEQSLKVPGGVRHLHVEVALGTGLSPLLIRGALLTLINVLVFALLWVLGETLSGLYRWGPIVRALRLHSYRTRLTLAMGVFFVVPTLGFAVWSVGRLATEVNLTRDLVLQQTLQDAAVAADLESATDADPLLRFDSLAGQFNADLIVYEGGQLVHTTTPVLSELGLADPYLPPRLFRELVIEDGFEVNADRDLGGRPIRVAYRTLGALDSKPLVLASPRLKQERGATETYALLLAIALGLTAAAWMAARAAGALAMPVRALSRAASAVGRGEPVPEFDPGTPSEFVPVVDAFERMASAVRQHQAALEKALRFTGAILSNVATGVVALDRDLRATTANPRAVSLLGVQPDPTQVIDDATDPMWRPVWMWVRSFVASGREVDAEEFTIGEMRIRAQVATLSAAGGGLVVALDDTTELAMAERVLAWGEMARQVAHEIKNPLTPIRLGMQHLQRAYANPRGDFDATLDRTSQQILAEIERLDAIARAFARFGAPPAESSPIADVDLAEVARETVSLYSLGGGATVELTVRNGARARLRPDELKEVLINLIENAKGAGASAISIEIGEGCEGHAQFVVRDNGRGIRPEDLPRIFEPHFSTNTSGTGLGLAICKRLVESWGGTIRAESEVGSGTSMIFEIG